jgi:hypothetical protein
MMGIPLSSGYIQFVPAGVRATLSYPAPVQTARDFDRTMRSDLYRGLVKKMGEKEVLSAIREDAALHGSPLKHVLESLDRDTSPKGAVSYRYLSGMYGDGMPYNGVLARLNFKEESWSFIAVSSPDSPRTVSQFVHAFGRKTGKKALIAWNGGYILNPELVGKLGLSETYIGSPLGLFINEGLMTSAPLFNKPALLVYKDGSIDIKRVNSQRGLGVFWKSGQLIFGPREYNNPAGKKAYYDLLYEKETLDGNGRTIIRLAGNVVKEVLKTGRGEQVKIIPVGLTLVLNPEEVPDGLIAGERVELMVPGLEDVRHAVEAGPLLLESGDCAIDMELEGWKHRNSIRTQAARLDYTDMRGPKIAVGINRKNELAVLTINGRIRESVGATHQDMSEILREHGMERAMGFDPGGSSTLVVDGHTLNISPYNSRYEQDVYALPPEPRAVSNAILAYLEK